MKTSELTGAALDWAVAKCEDMSDSVYMPLHNEGFSVVLEDGIIYSPRRDWSQGGPLIEREEIGVEPVYCDGKLDGWRAAGHELEHDEVGDYIDGSDHMIYGPTPLIVAMRCYVASKLGDEVEIPEELV